MKLYIDTDLIFSTVYNPGSSDEFLSNNQEYYSEMEAIAKKFSIGSYFDNRQDGIYIKIHAQKVTLTDVSMNDFFVNFLTELFDLTIEFSPMGGSGCEFAIRIASANPILI